MSELTLMYYHQQLQLMNDYFWKQASFFLRDEQDYNQDLQLIHKQWLQLYLDISLEKFPMDSWKISNVYFELLYSIHLGGNFIYSKKEKK